jgi:iron-sulfur cluster repair protein YtfE (RIC family)
MQTPISELMAEEHKKINQILEEFENSQSRDYKGLKNLFEIFKWNLDKHFFIEEKVIFHIYNSSSEENFEDIINLLKDHKDILWLISKAEESLKNNIKPEIIELKKLLIAHSKLEDAVFYPRLDKELNAEEKAMIIERFEEIIGE